MSEAASDEARCPFLHTGVGDGSNLDWWPNQLNLRILHQHSPRANPLGEGFDYKAAFSSVDLAELRRDLEAVMTTSQSWWPADWGHYGPLFVRMAWHAAGTYRVADGRGGAGTGAQRLAPVNSWPDNANLDKARRLLWPVKQKWGRHLSWGDLIVFAGTCALEAMGVRTLGFGGGRVDVFETEEDVNWGPERTWLGDERTGQPGEIAGPFGSVQMGLIYVNPEGPGGNPDPLAAAQDIRETFARMAMDDEETVALIAGGHTFGKCHGAVDPARYVGAEPEGAPLEQQGLGWKNTYRTGSGPYTYTSGIEGPWTANPTRWDTGYLDNLFGYDWEPTTSPAGATQWVPTDPAAREQVPDAHDPSRRTPPMMLTTDIALKVDPRYRRIAERFRQHPEALEQAFARAWFKLTHRDMGPRSRYLGPLVPEEPQIWQDPVPAVDHELVDERDVAELKRSLLDSGLTVAQLVRTAWASASTFRRTDKRGGANGARIRLAPQRDWPVNDPVELAAVLGVLERIKARFDEAQRGGRRISLADLIVLGGCAGIEEAARRAGVRVSVPFVPGRTDASEAQTDVQSFAVLEPRADGFRNYLRPGEQLPPEHLLVERASLLGLSAPEMTVLVGGLRVLGATFADRAIGVLTDRRGLLTTDFFVNLLDMGTVWSPSAAEEHTYEGRDRASGRLRWTASAVDLVFGANSQLRAIAEVYAASDAREKFAADFVVAWDKVMMADRFEVAWR
ncbi:MAG TPA: catalase/peroxidase HPI [Acidimicrobiales bacterium]|nr:catalase/peroxidase HPI [Acidimicrobiales bacterium]